MEVLRPNTVIGPPGSQFIIKELIGTGGMGQVYRARDAMLPKHEVAIKTLNPNLATEPHYAERFLNEAQAASSIKHPHVVRIDRYFVYEGKPYIVMDYLKGINLDALLRQAVLEVTRVVDIILSVAAAVYFCHRHKIYHRDLKPANVFLVETEDAVLDHVVVLDFGVAKIATEPGVTRAGSLMGTPSFLAPESLVDSPANPLSDQYSLAVLLYYALTRKLPFRAAEELQLFQAIRAGVYTPPRSLRPEIPDGVERAIARAMSVDPSARFENVHMFGRALLPFASPAGQQHWSSLFTAIPRPVKAPALSAAISIPLGQPFDKTIVDLLPRTRDVYGAPTVVSPSPAAADIDANTTVSDLPPPSSIPTLEPPLVPPSLSALDIVPASPRPEFHQPAAAATGSSEIPGPTSRVRRVLNPFVLTGAGAVLGIAIVVVALALARAPHRRAPTPPPPFSDRTTQPASAYVAPALPPPTAPLPLAPQPPPSSPPTTAAPSSLVPTRSSALGDDDVRAAPAGTATSTPASSPTAPIHKSHRPKHILRDENGIPIIK